MRIISLNVSLPRDVKWRGQIVSTAIFKQPVQTRLKVGMLNIEGDEQADLTVHGGPDKAVYAYAAEHYTAWRNELEGRDLPWGMFGENLTIEGGLFEDNIFVGDRFLVGTAELMAIQPRMPCYKLGIRFGAQRFVKQFAKSGRYGVYFRVIKEGDVGVNDPVEKIAASPHHVSIGDLGRLLLDTQIDASILQEAVRIDLIPARFREYFQSIINNQRIAE